MKAEFGGTESNVTTCTGPLAELERLRPLLWRCRQFIVDNVSTGAELEMVLEIDKVLAVDEKGN